MHHRRLRLAAVMSLAVAAIAGCGSGHDSLVEGVVTFDGQPLQRGAVTFHPRAGGAAAVGTISADGSFVIKTGAATGLAPGEYTVTVVAAEDPPPAAVGQTSLPGKLITPPRYGQVATSDLRAMVESGSNNFEFKLLP